MKRREFAFGAAGLAIGMPVLLRAQTRIPEDGHDFRTLDKRVAVEAPAGKIEIVDFFWYNCPHCNAFEPALQAWSKKLPEDVVLRRVPAAFRDDMVPQQRLFYALDALGKVADLHVKVFDAIHKEGADLTRIGPMAQWVAKQGIDPQKFTDIYNSFTISAKARRAVEIQDGYQVEGVPAFGIAGRWYTDPTLAGDNSRFIRAAEFLIAKARDTK
ncbi:MAG TPA: thiol:disulfide interchange protein DsbA/DsbL [Ramlibacter sp.]|nr:thiol:disulfide interchange protein DsbA/DsbL [Ramlibacter sp.]